MTPRLFAVDMDGTLLTDHDKSFDAELFDKVLTKLENTNGYFVVATGNQYPKSLEYMKDFQGRGIYFIAENGAYIADGTEDLKISCFSRQAVNEIWKVLEEDFPQVGIVISSYQGAFVQANRAETIIELMHSHIAELGIKLEEEPHYLDFINRFYPGTQEINSLAELEGKDIIKFALQTPREQTVDLVEQLSAKLPPSVVPVQSGFGAIDLVSSGVNKGAALAWLCEKLGVNATDVTAFGDASNDIEMLRFAGTGVAMRNATENVKEVADLEIGSNQDGAVLKYIAEALQL